MNNKDFANEVLNIVNVLGNRLSIKLNYNLSSIDNPEICDLINEDEDDKVVGRKNGECQTSSNWHIKYWERQLPGDMKE